MDLTFKRKCCQGTFDRSSMHNVNLAVPAEHIHTTIDKVEIAAGHFKSSKRLSRVFWVYVLIVVVAIGYFTLRSGSHLRNGRPDGAVGPVPDGKNGPRKGQNGLGAGPGVKGQDRPRADGPSGQQGHGRGDGPELNGKRGSEERPNEKAGGNHQRPHNRREQRAAQLPTQPPVQMTPLTSGQKPLKGHSQQGQKPEGRPGQAPSQGRPQGPSQQGQKPDGRPGQAPSQGRPQGPSQQGQKPDGRPGQAPSQGRPQGPSQQGQKPDGRPGQAPSQGRPQGPSQQGQKPDGRPGQAPSQGRPQGPSQQGQNPPQGPSLPKPAQPTTPSKPRLLQTTPPTTPSTPTPQRQSPRSPTAPSTSPIEPIPQSSPSTPPTVKKEDKREGKDGGRRRYRGYVKIGIALLVVPIILLCLAIRNSKKLYRKVSRVLELENNVFAQRYGYEWSINKCMTELTLRRSDSSRRVENSGTQLQSMPYQGAPMFTEESQYGQRGFQERNYDRVNLDDSTAIYK